MGSEINKEAFEKIKNIMEQQKKYDVFISSKSEDYPIAREICRFLESKGYVVFFAEKSIPFGADSLFKNTIDSALDSAMNMIVVCSNPEFLKDGWVYYEWNTFSVEILSGRKSKSNILTVLGISSAISKLPIGLRSYQSLYVNSYQETICDYLGHPSQLVENESQHASVGITTFDIQIDTRSQKPINNYEEGVDSNNSIVVSNQANVNNTTQQVSENPETIGDVKDALISNDKEVDIPTINTKKVRRNICFTILTLIITIVLGSICAVSIARKTLRYEYDYMNKTATVVFSKIFDVTGNVKIPCVIKHRGKIYTVAAIDEYAFEDCSALTSITIPNSVTNIGNGAFSYCKNLTSITIPHSVISIGEGLFNGCSALTSIMWNMKNCSNFSDTTSLFFDSHSKITSFTFGDSVQYIPAYLCYKMDNITSITIPNSVTTIGNGAFYGCTGLTSADIGNSVTSIGCNTFQNCYDLNKVIIGNNVVIIGNYAFSNCKNLTSVSIPNNVMSIGRCAFYGCYNLTSITIPNSVTSIGNMAFYGCTSLTSITIPNSLTSIGNWVFEDCSALTSITIPSSVTNIGNGAFSGCSSLTSITIPNSVMSIGDGVFLECERLCSIKYEGTITQWNEINKSEKWNYKSSIHVISCTDGEIKDPDRDHYLNF